MTPTVTGEIVPNPVAEFADEFAEIEVEKSPPVKVRLDLNRLTWGDMLALQGAIRGGEAQNEDNLRIINEVLNRVLIHPKVNELPVMTFQRVLQFVMSKMQAMANQGN